MQDIMRKQSGARIGENGPGKFAVLRSWVFILPLVVLSGCLGSLFNKSAAPDYYQIDYPFQPLSCAKPFPGAVRIWPFNAPAPFDRDQMIMISPLLPGPLLVTLQMGQPCRKHDRRQSDA